MSELASMSECAKELLTELLATAPLFAGVDKAVLATVSQSFRTAFFRDGETICRLGDAGDSLLIIWKGEVDISRDGVHLAVRREGELVGEQALIERVRRGATIAAKGLVQVIAVPIDAFDTLLHDTAFARNLLKAVSEKLNQATRQRAFRFSVEQLLFAEFKAHVARPVLDELLAQREEYGRPRSIDAVVLFSDIRVFSARSALLEPERIARELGAYLEHAVDVIHKHRGFVDKFIGDAVMAIWGWPSHADHDPHQDALMCACELVETAPAFLLGGDPITIGVGINAGRMFIGNIGSGDKRQFTVLGAVVNLAARYESACKELDAPIVMGSTFAERLNGKARQSLITHANHPVKGAEPQTLYSVPGTAVRTVVSGK